jgi:hypothetical protein
MSIEEKFKESLKKLTSRSLLTLKTARSPSTETLKIGCSLVAIFFYNIEKKHDNNEIYEVNSGINVELYNFYYKDSYQMFQVILDSEKLIEDQEIPLENIKFARLVLQGLENEVHTLTGDVGAAVKNIFEFLLCFIQYYLYKCKDVPNSQKKICKIL